MVFTAKRFLLFVFCCLLILALAAAAGPYWINPLVLFDFDFLGAQRNILLFLRLPRIVAALCTGGALAAAGSAAQAVFRNPLASPDLMGVSAGASLGALAAIVGGIGATHQIFIFLAALAGAALSLSLAARLVFAFGRASLLSIILAGLAFSALAGGAAALILLFAREQQAAAYVHWAMGSIEGVSWSKLALSLPFMAISCAFLWSRYRAFDALLFGWHSAYSLGFDSRFLMLPVLTAIAVIAAASASLCGPIGFIGLMAPHAARRFVGAGHKNQFPLSIVLGALFLLLCDTAGRSLFAPFEIKAGILASLMGGGYFLYLTARLQRAFAV